MPNDTTYDYIIGGGAYHGVGGPLKVSHLGHTSPMSRTYVKTMQELGLPYNADFNCKGQFGVGFMQHTIDWATHCKRTVKTGYHPAGICRVGFDGDGDAVLSCDLRVRGATGVQVIDASLMPNIVSGNTNAAVMAAAGKATNLILAR